MKCYRHLNYLTNITKKLNLLIDNQESKSLIKITRVNFSNKTCQMIKIIKEDITLWIVN